MAGFTTEGIPTFRGPLAYFATGGQLRAEDWRSGRVVWTFLGDGFLFSAPILSGGTLYVASSVGNVYAVDARSGRGVGRAAVDQPVLPDEVPEQGDVSAGLGAGMGLLVVPATDELVAFSAS